MTATFPFSTYKTTPQLISLQLIHTWKRRKKRREEGKDSDLLGLREPILALRNHPTFSKHLQTT